VTLKGRGHDPNIFNARYFQNGSREKLGYKGHLQEMAYTVSNGHMTDDVT